MRNKFILAIGMVLLVFGGVLFLVFQEGFRKLILLEEPIIVDSEVREGCSIKVEERIVRGSSLTPLVEAGEIVTILFGYYDCHQIRRNDVIAYNYSGRSDPIIKVVKGLPGDTFHLEKNNMGWNILINNKIVKNSQDEPYLLSEKKSKMLALYESDYQGVIPENSFLILGNLVSGSLDSTRFGLIDKSNTLGKVELD